jgi:RecA-family ATPase
MTAQATTAAAHASLPPNVQDALDYCRNVVEGAEDLEGMFRLGATAVFRHAKQGDPHFTDAVDALYSVANAAGLVDDDATQKLLNAGIADAKKPAPNGNRAAIITPADLQTFFGDWRAAIEAATDRETKWQEFAAAVRGKLLTMEIGAMVATDNLRLIAAELDLCTAAELDAKVTAALDGTVTPPPKNGHTAAPSPDDYGATIPIAHLPATLDDTSAIVPATFITPASWPNEAPPPVDWFVENRIPFGDVTAMHGDGGAGKTDLALRLFADAARNAAAWLGHEIKRGGRVLFISGEEPERELRRRMWLHAQHDGYRLADLADNFRIWTPDNISDALLAVADRHTGIMRPTKTMQQIAAAVLDYAPIAIAVDNVAATCGGNLIDRLVARSYVNLWRQIAHTPSRPAVLLLDHPSLSGMTNGTGRAGSMDWRNAVRSALWLHTPSDGAEADRGIRILETTKSNYGPPGNPLRLVWADGGLQLEHAPTSLHRLAKDAECDATFLRLLDEREGQGRHVSSEARASTYAAKAFADMPNNDGFARNAFAAAMERLLQAGKIHQIFEGPASRPRGRLVRKAAA